MSASALSGFVKSNGIGGMKMSLNGAPEYSPATGLKNQFYNWKGQKIRYQSTGPEDAEQSVLLGEEKNVLEFLNIVSPFTFIFVFLISNI